MSNQAILVRLPEGVRAAVERLAAINGVTPEQFLASAAAEKVDAMLDPAAYFAARAAKAKPGVLSAFLSREGGEEPRVGDRIGEDAA
jgi:hypothetical protein